MADLLDRITLDLLDRIELSSEDKVVYSSEMQKQLSDSIQDEISKLSLDEMISKLIKYEMSNQKERLDKDFDKKQKLDESFKHELESRINKAKLDLEERMGKKYDALVNKISREAPPRYQFGGFPPPGGGLPIPGSGGLMEWRFLIVGANLVVQKLESGTWVEKASFLP